jgi:pheromone shutdown-related protein TraB
MDPASPSPANVSALTSLAEQPLQVVERDGCRFHLLGTAHVSRASAEAVHTITATQSFDAIAVELDDQRFAAMRDPDGWRKLDLFQVIKTGKVGFLAANIALSAYQRRIAEQFGIEPGAEMKAAWDAASQQAKPLWLIDRNIGLTLRRVAAGFGFWQRCQMLSGIVVSIFSDDKIEEAQIEELKKGDMLKSTFAELANDNAALYESLIDERDRFMAAQLRKQRTENDRDVLVVIGAGHLAGIAKYLEQTDFPIERTIERLNEPPAKSIWPKVISYATMAILIGGFIIGFHRGFSVGADLLTFYLLATGGGAALGAILGGAHPLSVLAALVSAPLTVLHPALASGMFSAGTELYLRKPTVADFDSLKTDLNETSGWWRNRVSRILLIFMLTNFLTMIGAWATGLKFFKAIVHP